MSTEPESQVYSSRLGPISDEQFQAVAQRHALGRFVRAEAIAQGLFGQNVFLSTTEGEYVLRGAPHWVRRPGEKDWRRQDQWQFHKERFFASTLARTTRVPVPWPMIHETRTDIFGWPYLIMPKMPGISLEDRSLRKLSPERRFSIATALGSCLAEMQQLTAAAAAEIDVDSLQLTPFPGGDTRFVIAQTREIAERAAMRGAIDHSEAEWIEMTCRAAETLQAPRITYVHVDYKTGNLCLTETTNGYRVSGLFDFHEARFGNGTQDLVRQACSFIDFDLNCAHEFLRSTLAHGGLQFRIDELMRLFVINDRIKIWEYFTHPEVAPVMPEGMRFSDWAKRYLESGVFTP